MLPLPVVLEPNGYWAGIDGNWSTWSVWAGTPPQQFQVWPSTSSGEVWLPLPDGCPPTEFWSTVECAASRGVGSSEDSGSAGFQKNVSGTWEEIGIYELLTGNDLFQGNQTALYGLDEVSLGKEETYLSDQLVAGIATPEFWLGSLGLTQSSSAFDVRSEGVPSLLETMKAQNLTPSASFGLAVGAHHGQ